MTTVTTPTKLQSLIYVSSSASHDGKSSLQVLDQLLLPSETKYIPVPDIQTTFRVIHDMNIRGAPLIAIVAILGLTVDLQNDTSTKELDTIETVHQGGNVNDAIVAYIEGKLDYIAKSRPTAVNLFNAIAELKAKLQTAKAGGRQQLLKTIQEYSEFMLQRDVQDNKAIGDNGAQLILNSVAPSKTKVRVLTICNTGSLATAGYGTALGIIRSLIELNALDRVFALETRPYNQGSRLTAYEMVVEQMPNATLLCDSMAAAAIQKYNIDVIVVGADRVCANGDTANKIGTYNLSLVAAALNVPFYVAAPFTTLDINKATGNEIPIEERKASEIIDTSNAPSTIQVWNPAFDITPAKYITGGIVTEKGIILPNPDGKLNVREFVERHTGVATERKESQLVIPDGYVEHTTASLPQFVWDNIPGARELLEVTSANDIDCVEMGDGNLNLVFIVSSKNTPKKIIIKQALPYVRCVGESWPMTIDRSYYEYTALQAEKKACPQHVPDLYYFSKPLALIAMQYLAPPIQILRKGLIQGIQYKTMAQNLGTFCAKTLFQTSGFALGTSELRKQVEFWSTNHEMCALTESVVFTEPYITHGNNRWTTPELDDDKKAIETDLPLKLAANQLKVKFVTLTQALIHADLHSGSVMTGEGIDETYVIDPEFAFYGPMGFDLGAFIANLFLAYVAHPGHSGKPNRASDYDEWILQQIATFWNTFVTEFTNQWYNSDHHTGFVFGRDKLSYHYGTDLDNDNHLSATKIDALFFQGLLHDTIGFAGMKMIRRIVGIAHVEDLESITDVTIRAQCERRGLNIGKLFVKQSTTFKSIDDVIALARATK